MIEFTIKTLESNNHHFSVEDETTVAQLKEQIREEMGIAIASQRLIFCGRVLTDDRRLADCDVNGKVIHLVPRPPPSPQSRNAPHNPREEMREALEEAQRVIDRMSNQTSRQAPMRHIWSIDPPSELVLDQHQAMMMTPTANRLEFIRRTLDDIRNSLSALFTHMANGNSGATARPPAEPMETETSPPTETHPTETPPTETPQTETLPTETPPTETPPTETPSTRREAEDMGDEFNDILGGNGGMAPPRRRPMRPPRPSLTRPRDLAQLVDELDQLHEEFAPFRGNYLAILRDSSSAQLPQDERIHRQNIVELVCDVMHSFSHAYHAISDINVAIGERFPRLTSGFSANRHQIPVQAHINVVHTTRRPTETNGPAGGTASTGPTSNSTATRVQGQTPLVAAFRAQRANAAGANGATVTAAGAASAGSGAAAPQEERQNLFHTTSGRNTIQAAFPESITYQLEIQTPMPLALPIDTALLNGVAAFATNFLQGQNLQSQQNQASQQGPGQEQSQGQGQGQGQAQGQAQTQNQSQAQPGQDQVPEQDGRPRVLIDIENLLRTLGQAHPGVEVVMSMEEIYPLDTPPGSSPVGNGPPAYNAPPVGNAPPVYNTPPVGNAPPVSNALPGGGFTATLFSAVPNPAVFRTGTGPGTGFHVSGFGTEAGTVDSSGSGPGAGNGTGAATGGGTGRGAGSGAGHATVAGAPGFGGLRFDRPPFGPGISIPGVPGIGVGPDGAPTFTAGVGVAGYGPATFTLQPDGGVFLAPVGPNNTAGMAGEILQNMFTSIFRQPNSTQTPNAAPTNTVPTNTAPTNTVSSTAAPANPASANSAPVNSAPVNSGPTNSATANSASANASPANFATSNISNPMRGTTFSFTPYNTPDNFSGRTSDGGWGFGPGHAYPNVVHLENITTSPGPGQERLEPLLTMAHRRATMAQAIRRRRNAERQNSSQPGTSQTERNRQSANNARAHHLAMACMVYDRFLSCDSLHARQRLSERRAAYQELHNEHMRQRATRPAAPDIDTLEERNYHFTMRHMAIMMRLLSGPVSIEGRLNAFMVTVARVLYLEPNSRPRTYDPLCMPREFLFVRMQMREYMQRVLETVIDDNAERSPFEGVANLILRHQRTFLDNMLLNVYTPIDPLVDPMCQLRSWLRARMPAIIACVMSESANDVFVTRFYAVFSRFFTDLCALFLGFCVNGFDGLRTLYTALIDHATESFEATAREWIRLLSRENLLAIQRTIDPQSPVNYYSNYRYDGTPRPRVAGMQSESYRLTPGQRRQLPHICEHHQRTTMPLTTPPLLPPPRNDTPDTLDSLPSMSIPTMSSSSDASESPQPPENEEDHEGEMESNDEVTGSPPLQEGDEDGSGADTVSTTSHNTFPRSPVLTRSAATSPIHTTPPPVSTPRNESNGQSEQIADSGRSEQNKQSVQNGQSDQNRQSEQNAQSNEARALSPAHDSTQTSSNRSSLGSPEFAPPVMILEHWGEEWVPVFTRDRNAQRERDRSQEPHSDAYLSGMPSRKRRCLRASRPPTTLDGFMNESVREASERTPSLDPAQLRGVLRDSVRTLVRARAEASEDYDPVRYAATARFLDQTKRNKESEKKSEKVD